MRIHLILAALILGAAGSLSHADPPASGTWRLAFEDNFGEYVFGRNPTVADGGRSVLDIGGVSAGFMTLVYPRWADADTRGLRYLVETLHGEAWSAAAAAEIGSRPHSRPGMVWARCRVPVSGEREFFSLRVSG